MSETNKPDAPLGVVVPPVRQRLFDWLRERLVAGMLIALPIVAGLPAYLDWISQSTQES